MRNSGVEIILPYALIPTPAYKDDCPDIGDCIQILITAAYATLLYTLIQSPGYFAQKGQAAFVVMFLILIVLAASFSILSFRSKAGFELKQ